MFSKLYKNLLGFFIILSSTMALADTSLPQSVESLAPAMFTTLALQQKVYQEKMLATHPVIVALFSPSGGQFVLYRPGQSPLTAPALPQAADYELATMIEHTAMAIYALAIDGQNNPTANPSWQSQMQSYQIKIKAADHDIDHLNVSDEEKALFHKILETTHDFIALNLKQNTLSQQSTKAYAQALKPYFVELSTIVISAEVGHWMQVTAKWKQVLGSSWNNTYGVVLYIPTRPKNNILLGILAHYMGNDAVGKRLFYFTAPTYTPTAEEAIFLLAKAAPDNALAKNVFGEYYLSYSQILGQIARAEISSSSQ